ncbi:uncharacterized protein LOC143288451 isoform X1 [Babylonia areolata]|uniref:uncharacterized protein LOC143288451 isoform X1 n=1 Tax=Babylonia areolata TaxID=304850 RepID=UPI003FD4036E
MEESSTVMERGASGTSTESVGQPGFREDCGVWSPDRTMVGSTAADVDSIKEVIQADHHYHKVEPVFSVYSSPLQSQFSDQVLPADPSEDVKDLKSVQIVSSEYIIWDEVHQDSDVTYTPAADCQAADEGSDSHIQQTNISTVMNPTVMPVAICSSVYSAHGDTSKTQGEATVYLSKEMLESLEGLLTVDNISTVVLPNEQPLAVTSTISDKVFVTQSVGHHNIVEQDPQHASIFLSLHSDRCSKGKVCDIDCLSPDSGFSENEEDACSSCCECDISPSPVSLSCADMDSMVWQDDFVDLHLFPDVGI